MTAIEAGTTYRLLPAGRPATELETELLARWREEALFARTLAAREGAPSFVFFEGPPTANGRPGIHHVFSRTLKDLFCRHRAMQGFRVLRKAGWDTHGLPVEIEVEKELQREREASGVQSVDAAGRPVRGKQLIEEIGVEEFNRRCRESVWTYRGDWQRLSERIGYWLDYEHPYVTYTNEYIESVWWALATLHGKDLLYKGHKILPYCARCGTSLSSHEVAQGYEDVRDPSIFVALELTDTPGRAAASGARRRILVWTTTPWTLVSNVALAVHPDLEYVELRARDSHDGSQAAARGADAGTLLLAAARAGAVLGDDFTDRWEIVGRYPGRELAGWRYQRPLDWASLDGVPGGHGVVVAESFVSADDGSGIVHMAPAFGADDYAAGQRHGLAFLQPVNAAGEFPVGMPVVGGMFVKAADPKIIEELKRRGVLWKAGTIEHAYPHCWRCGTPLLYYARTSWFVRTTAFRDQMLARNARVRWTPPEMGEGRFGEWLKNNIDWAISRDRYWGTPLPIWECDADPNHREAIGSFAELERRRGEPLGEGFDPHKPFIDRITWQCGTCAGTMRRVPEVIDAWFDSGSMPFAQWHFPFENEAAFREQYPADFIAEGVDQTRGWFYSLLAIATGLGDALPNNGTAEGSDRTSLTAAPYRAVVVNDLVLDADGQKMSKSRGNVVDPWEAIERHGVDALRLFFVASAQVWVPRRFDEKAIRELTGRFLVQLKNVYSGIFAQYANFGWSPSEQDPAPAGRPVLDRWILSRLATVEREANRMLTEFDATGSARAILEFVDDDVSNWYVRLSRPRFYEVDDADNRAAFATLHEVLVVTCRLLAPFAPYVSDWIHRELTGQSVHLAPYTRPRVEGGGHGLAGARTDADPVLEDAMAAVRRLATLGRAAREEHGVNVRQPLPRLVCVTPRSMGDALDALVPLLAAELNVKSVEFASSADALVTLEAKPNFRALGKKFGKETPLAAQAVAALPSEALRGFEHGEPLSVAVGHESRRLDAEDLTIVRRASGALVVKEEGGFFAALDPTITPSLRREGLARELISRVQRLRKEAGFAVSDRITLRVGGDAAMLEAVQEYRQRIAEEVLAREIVLDDGRQAAGEPHVQRTFDLDGLSVRVALNRER